MYQPSKIEYLPSKILYKIFSYVNEEDVCNAVPFVCNKWKLASSHSLSIIKNATFEGTVNSPQEICYALHHAASLKTVKLSSVHDVVTVLRQLCRSNKQVEKLTLKGCSNEGKLVPEESLINIVASLPDLKSIELNHTKFESPLFLEILARKSTITSIDLSLNEFVTLGDLLILVHNIKIKEFKLSRRYKHPEISDEEMAHLVKMMKPQLVLLHLDMSGMGDYTYSVVFSCSKLINLKLNNAMNLSTGLLKNLPLNLKKIEHLKIEGPSTISKGDIHKTLFINSDLGGKLESLKLENFVALNDEECCNILEVCINLKALSLRGCRALTLEGIYPSLLKMFNLTFLNVAFIGKPNGIQKVSNLSHLDTLVVDQASHESSATSTLANKKLKILKLPRKLLNQEMEQSSEIQILNKIF